MRIVEYEKDTTSIPFLVIRGVAYVSAIFSVIIAVLLITNQLRVTRLDPVHSPALERLVEELKSNPQDQALREEIRELDYLARKAFFTSQHFNRMATFLLLGGLAVMVVSFKTLRAYQPAPPYPDSSEPKEDPSANAHWARKSVTAVGLILVGFSLMLALPWNSPLDRSSMAIPDPVPAKHYPTMEEMNNNWPSFLGAASGHSRGQNVPVQWDLATGEGLLWKSKVPLGGFNSPVVWKDRVFLTGASATNREVYCFHVETGDLVWQQSIKNMAGPQPVPLKIAEDTGYAASTVATDGSRVFAIFANGDIAALNASGKELWARHLGVPHNSYGYASSLLTFEDLVIVQFDRKKDSFVCGLDVATGETRWKTPRDFGPSWASPRLIQTAEAFQVITVASPSVVAYDPKNGQELWRVDCLKDAEVACSPTYAGGILYVAAEYANLTAIDVATKKILWQTEDLIPGVSTPLVVNDLMFFGLTDGGIVCLDAKTGAEVWLEETDDVVYASPVLVGDRIYLVDRGGNVHIFKADRAGYQALGQPTLGEQAVSTPAVTGDSLFCRSVNHLFRFGP